MVDLTTGEECFFTADRRSTFAPDGHTVAVPTRPEPRGGEIEDGGIPTGGPSDSGIDLVNIGSGDSRRIAIADGGAKALAFSPDGSIMAISSAPRGRTIRLYRTADGVKIADFACPADRTHPGALAFSPDGRSLAAGLDDTTVLIWDVKTDP